MARSLIGCAPSSQWANIAGKEDEEAMVWSTSRLVLEMLSSMVADALIVVKRGCQWSIEVEGRRLQNTSVLDIQERSPGRAVVLVARLDIARSVSMNWFPSQKLRLTFACALYVYNLSLTSNTNVQTYISKVTILCYQPMMKPADEVKSVPFVANP